MKYRQAMQKRADSKAEATLQDLDYLRNAYARQEQVRKQQEEYQAQLDAQNAPRMGATYGRFDPGAQKVNTFDPTKLVRHYSRKAKGAVSDDTLKSEIEKAYAQGTQDFNSHQGYFNNILPYSEAGLAERLAVGATLPFRFVSKMFRGKNVDMDWYHKKLQRGYTGNALEDAKIDAYNQALQDADKGQGAMNKEMRRADASAHIIGRGINGITLGIGNLGDKAVALSDKTLDRSREAPSSTEQMAQRYGRLYGNQFGDEAAAKAEKWLRVAGTGTEIAGNLAVGIAAGGGPIGRAVHLTKWKRLADAGTTGGRMLNMAAGGVLKGMRLGHISALGNTLTGAVDVATNGGKEQIHNRFGNALATGANFAGGFMQGWPEWSMIGGGLGALGHGIKATGMLNTPVAQAVRNAVTPVYNAVHTWAASNRAVPWSEKTLGTVGKVVQWPLKKVTQWTRGGAELGAMQLTSRLLNSYSEGMPSAKEIPGMFFGMKNQLALNLGYPVLSSLFLDKMDWHARGRAAGNIDEQLDANMKAMLKDPTKRRDMLYELKRAGIKMADNPNDAQLREGLEDYYANVRDQSAANNMFSKLDSSVDWDSFQSVADLQNRLSSYTDDQLRDAKFKAYREEVIQGGPVTDRMFSDGDLNAKQRKDLLENYLLAEDRRQNGFLKGNVISQILRGGADSTGMVTDLMRKSKYARNALVGYARGAIADSIAKGGGVALGPMETEILKAMSPEEKNKMFKGAFDDASADQLIAMQASGKTGVLGDKDMQTAATRALVDRMQHDGNFAAEYMAGMQSNLQAGTGLTPEMKAAAADAVSKMNPIEMFETMDDDRFFALARTMMSQDGNGILDSLPEKDAKIIKERFRRVAEMRAKFAWLSNPFKNTPAMVGLWLANRGWNGAADFAQNPAAFWSTAALATGGLMLTANSLGGESRSSSAVAESRNRSLAGMMGNIYAI